MFFHLIIKTPTTVFFAVKTFCEAVCSYFNSYSQELWVYVCVYNSCICIGFIYIFESRKSKDLLIVRCFFGGIEKVNK